MTGTVKSFVASRGFGFVNLADGREVFVHNTEIKSTGFRMLVPNSTVKFELVENDGKMRATQVRNVDDSPITAPPKEQQQTNSNTSETRGRPRSSGSRY